MKGIKLKSILAIVFVLFLTLSFTACGGNGGGDSGTSAYIIASTAGVNGSISPDGATTVNSGTDQTYTITPDASYDISDVLVDGVSVGAVTTYTFTNVTADHTIEARFGANIITATAGANGSISPSGDVEVSDGSDQTFTITPDASYYVADVLVDSVSVGAMTSYTFTNVTADHTIAASFGTGDRTITASAGANGTIDPSGVVTVNPGTDQTFTITPDVNYFVSDVLVDGPIGIRILPASSGVQDLTHLTEGQRLQFLAELDQFIGDQVFQVRGIIDFFKYRIPSGIQTSNILM